MDTIRTLLASTYQRTMHHGRTLPCVFICEDEIEESSTEYVVKLKGGIDSREKGLVAELMASQLAGFLDVPVPEYAIIEVNDTIVDGITDTSVISRVRKSLGKNFGSRYLSGGFVTWPKGKSIPMQFREVGIEILAFDALIQNPDRRPDKPNILENGAEIYIIDHELGFSFLSAILKPKPWEISKLTFMREHLFYKYFKGKNFNLDRFAGAIDSLSEDSVKKMCKNIPDEWGDDFLDPIRTHILEVKSHSNEFVDEVRRLLT